MYFIIIPLDIDICLVCYNLRDYRDWQLTKARIELRNIANWENLLIKCSHRPFDWRHSYFTEIATDYPRRELKEHVAGKENPHRRRLSRVSARTGAGGARSASCLEVFASVIARKRRGRLEDLPRRFGRFTEIRR